MIIYMFSLVKTYCINAAIIYLSKCISKLNETCISVFRHINVVTWHSIDTCDVPLWKLASMHCVTKTFYRLFHKWQHLHGNNGYSNPNLNSNPNPNPNPNPCSIVTSRYYDHVNNIWRWSGVSLLRTRDYLCITMSSISLCHLKQRTTATISRRLPKPPKA